MHADLFVTLWPTFDHFADFARDDRIAGIRLNSAMIAQPELREGLARIEAVQPTVPLYFDVKGRQLRVSEVLPNSAYLDIRLNHPIEVPTPTMVLFKAGSDPALLGTLSEGGYRLTFSANPRWRVRAGESLHIKDPNLVVRGDIFTQAEKEKIAIVAGSGLVRRWFISYVESWADLHQFTAMVPDFDEIFLKIESKQGLQWAQDNALQMPSKVRLVAACGDLFVEVDQPHDILEATRTIIHADPTALMGSRMMLSTCRTPSTYLSEQVRRLAERHPAASADILRVLENSLRPQDPDFADFTQVAWLYDQGYRSFMLCDELCLKGPTLQVAVGAFDALHKSYR